MELIAGKKNPKAESTGRAAVCSHALRASSRSVVGVTFTTLTPYYQYDGILHTIRRETIQIKRPIPTLDPVCDRLLNALDRLYLWQKKKKRKKKKDKRPSHQSGPRLHPPINSQEIPHVLQVDWVLQSLR